MNDTKGSKMCNTNFNIVCYFDGAIVIAENEGDLKMFLQKLNNVTSVMISTAKIKLNCSCKIKSEIDEEIVEYITKIKYL